MIVSKTFKIPQDALNANMIILPNTANIKIINSAVNLVLSPFSYRIFALNHCNCDMSALTVLLILC